MKGEEKMRFVIQRVSESTVKVDGEVIGQIGKGFMVLIGVSDSDTKETADKMVKKMLGLRIFEDEQGKTNLSLDTVGGGLLLISQFTLYANCKKGNRPSFIEAGGPEMAEEMYQYIIDRCSEQVEVVEHGRFGTDMKVSLTNDGPFTIILDSDQL
ncbi:D-tyrosyl-tRNA(Tyr) deacylase [[Clostridium] hylemonae DSM 15053]|uniref:D-aminoacyl-tRNA deacylase n=2 Tax=[Clostridium] hylemonae TaxID=89153 RepID=C0BVW3_9FIRM|nr:D-tyrosyl-tRNA(Tyr) deacylase [[Clostridium] hylemonae DSM 15053]